MGVSKKGDGTILRGFVLGAVVGTIALGVTVGLPAVGDYVDLSSIQVPGFSQSLIEAPAPPKQPEREPELNALLAEHLGRIPGPEGVTGAQAVLVETADGTPLMAHNAQRMLNPASVLKMATTVAALEKFGPSHRFRTVVTADGIVTDGTLAGSLCVRSDGDPTLGRTTVQPLVAGIKAAGIQRVAGDLVVAGPLSFQTTDEPDAAAAKLKDALEKAGIKVQGVARLADSVGGADLVTLESEPLLDIVTRQNAHSINRIADNMGTAVGGPAGLRRYLIDEVGVAPQEVYVTHPSGLDDNLISARGMMLVMHRLSEVCARHGIALDRVMPLNGVDNSTMRTRMTGDGMKGAVLAKTGTQANWGGGIATLAGVVHTKARGPLYFVIFNSVGDVHTYRKWQDALLKDAVASLGGPAPVARTENIVPLGAEGHSADQVARKAPAPAKKAVDAEPERDPFAGRRAD